MKSIHWPAILKLDGVDDLLYLASQNDLPVLAELRLGEGDRLIDCQGQSYCLDPVADEWRVQKQQTVDLAQFEAWVRAHLVAMQQCCVYKVELESFNQGLILVKDTQDV